MKILHINSYYNGAPLYTNLYERQINLGEEIDVYVPIEKRIDVKNKFVANTQFSFDYNKIERLLFFKKEKNIFKSIEQRYEINDYDLFHAHSLYTNGYVAYELKKKYGIPYVVAVRNSDVNVFLNKVPPLRNTGIEIMKNSSKIIFISYAYKDYVRKRFIKLDWISDFDEKTQVIPNGINEFWLENKFSRNYYPKKSVKILCVGDVEANKNQLNTCKACEELMKRGYNIELNIVGRVNDKKILSRLVESGANYLGTKHKEELIDIYRENDIFVMPSFHETFGLVYAEAMSQGLPVIYTEGQGFDRQFEEGFVGYHVDAVDPKDIANKIEKIVSEYDEISGRCIEASHKFDWSKISEEYRSIYDEILCECR